MLVESDPECNIIHNRKKAIIQFLIESYASFTSPKPIAGGGPHPIRHRPRVSPYFFFFGVAEAVVPLERVTGTGAAALGCLGLRTSLLLRFCSLAMSTSWKGRGRAGGACGDEMSRPHEEGGAGGMRHWTIMLSGKARPRPEAGMGGRWRRAGGVFARALSGRARGKTSGFRGPGAAFAMRLTASRR